MQISPQTRLDLGKVATITVAYILFTVFLAVYDHVMLNSPFAGEPTADYSFRTALLIHALSGLLAGTFGGYFLVLLNKRVKSSFPGRLPTGLQTPTVCGVLTRYRKD